MAARMRKTGRALALVAGAWLVAPDPVAADDERWIIEPVPEVADAQKQGAADVDRAQKLAKAKQYADAAAVLEPVARKLPASVHDCNLALVYLRAASLTRAQLLWDLSGLRGGSRPKWCTGEVSTQLADALRVSRYVPTTIDVVPPDAVIEVAGVAMRNMRTVWLPATPAAITVSAPGHVTKTEVVAVSSPTTRVTITLEREPVAPPVTPDPGPTAPVTPEPGPVTPPIEPPPGPAPAPVLAPATPAVDPLVTVGGSPLGFRAVSLTLAIVGWGAAGFFGYRTWAAQQDANDLYPTDPSFADARDDYTTARNLTIGFVGLGTVATVAAIYFFTRPDRIVPRPGKIRVGFGDGGVGVSFSGTFGGGGGK